MRRHGRENCNGGNRRYEGDEIRPDPQWDGRREGTRPEAIIRGPKEDRQKGGCGSVAVMAEHPKALRPFKPDKNRILEAILYIMNHTKGFTQYEIVKTLFLADRAHLNKYGRPVTFDNYVAMTHGPVPSLTYDLLKPNTNFNTYFDEERPWTIESEGKVNRFVKIQREHKKEVLSKTDISVLDSAIDIIVTLTFKQIKNVTHMDPAYVEAWQRRGTNDASDIDMIRLLEDRDQETIERLAYSTNSDA
jgi:uncharacterized phage-associated protein